MSSINHSGETLTITTRVQKSWGVMLFVIVWLGGWVAGELFAGMMIWIGVAELLAGGLWADAFDLFSGEGLFALAGFGMLTIVGGMLIRWFVWYLTGVETLEVRRDSLTLRRRILRLGHSKEYLAEHIQGLRISPPPPPSIFLQSTHDAWKYPMILVHSPLAFDYGAKTIRFGAGIDEAEAASILEAIYQYHPRYRPLE